jgi:hypothetical protein
MADKCEGIHQKSDKELREGRPHRLPWLINSVLLFCPVHQSAGRLVFSGSDSCESSWIAWRISSPKPRINSHPRILGRVLVRNVSKKMPRDFIDSRIFKIQSVIIRSDFVCLKA